MLQEHLPLRPSPMQVDFVQRVGPQQIFGPKALYHQQPKLLLQLQPIFFGFVKVSDGVQLWYLRSTRFGDRVLGESVEDPRGMHHIENHPDQLIETDELMRHIVRLEHIHQLGEETLF